MQNDVTFLGSASLDPVTKRKKINVGMYSKNHLQTEFNPKLGLFNIPQLSKVKTWDNKDITEYYRPIMSAVSDSGKIELYNGDFEQQNIIKFSCKTNEAENYISELKPERKREQFTCNINVKNSSERELIDEINKTVVLGFSYSHKRDLQPVMEEDITRTSSSTDGKVLSGVRIMGNLYIDEKTNQPKFILGLYRMSRRYDPTKHAEYWTPEYQPKDKDGNRAPWFFAMPIAEATTDSDYVELRSDFQNGHTYKVKAECMKSNSQMTWLEP
jgi:hypothetical protein